MIRILNAEPAGYCSKARAVLERVGEVTEKGVTRAELLECLSGFDVLIVRLNLQIDREIIDAGSALRVICSATTGLDHLDVEYARSRGIEVLSLFGETEFLRSIAATAEHTWALLLALFRRIPAAFEAVRSGQWERNNFRGNDLQGKHLGILGLGRIGEKVARYGQAFGMSVSAFDPNPVRWVEGVRRAETMRELLENADVLSVHVPLNPATFHLIGRNELALLPATAVLINTSRGAVIDTTALLESLEQGQLAGAALDVLEGEGDVGSLLTSPILDYARSHQNLIVTPHIGGATWDSMAATEIFMAEKVARFCAESANVTRC